MNKIAPKNLTDHLRSLDDEGAVVNPTFRNYRIAASADTYDAYGPRGAKSMGEAPIIPITAALADATDVRFTSLTFSADRILSKVTNEQ